MTSTNVNQAAFDKAAAHLLRQGSKSLQYPEDAGAQVELCAYRSPDEKMCAVGALIDDEHYYPDLEGGNATADAVLQAVEASGFEGVSPDLLLDMQEAHDESPPAEWRQVLRGVANWHDLDPAILDAGDPTYAL